MEEGCGVKYKKEKIQKMDFKELNLGK